MFWFKINVILIHFDFDDFEVGPKKKNLCSVDIVVIKFDSCTLQHPSLENLFYARFGDIKFNEKCSFIGNQLWD